MMFCLIWWYCNFFIPDLFSLTFIREVSFQKFYGVQWICAWSGGLKWKWNFRNVVDEKGLTNELHKFRDASYRDIVTEWCENNGIDWVEWKYNPENPDYILSFCKIQTKMLIMIWFHEGLLSVTPFSSSVHIVLE